MYKIASVTSVLDGSNRLVQMGANANEIIIPKMSMDGLADYSRANGYVNGNVTLTNETVKNPNIYILILRTVICRCVL